MQAGKEFINEGATAIVTGEYDLEKAATNAIVSAGTSVFYDKTIGNIIKTSDGNHKQAFNAAKETAAKQVAANQAQTLDVADEVFDSIDDSAASAVTNETVKETTKETMKNTFNTEYYMNTSITGRLLNVANEAGGKKVVGKAVKDTIKEFMKIPVQPVVEAIV